VRRVSGGRNILGLCALGAGITSCALGDALAQAAPPEGAVELPEVEVVSTSPLPGGGGESLDKIPGMVQTVPAEDFSRINSPNVTDTLQQMVPGAVSIDTNGNEFSQDFQYRGFEASPRQGVPQGLAVYLNGMRINEAFGDTVNWDLIPPQAIYSTNVFTNNPVFGLNALGGAVSLQMKNGFLWQGFNTQIMGGSYGRVSGLFEYGKQIDDYSLYVSGDATRDAGWRLFSPSSLFRAYGDLGYRSQGNELHFTMTGAHDSLGVIGATPVGLLDQLGYNAVFTNPQVTVNTAGSIALSGTFNINPQWSIASNFYIRAYEQRHTDGNDSDIQDCAGNSLPNSHAGSLCLDDSGFGGANGNAFVILGLNGQPIPVTPGIAYGTFDRTSIHATTYGAALQATDSEKFFEHENYLTFGASVDYSPLSFSATSTLGAILPNLFVVDGGGFPGSGSIITTSGLIGYVPIFLTGSTAYYGVYALDTFNITPELALTGGGRVNIAQIITGDTTGFSPGTDINATYSHINPVVGLAYKLSPTVTAYGGFSEANRVPMPVELACADPARPCLFENSLTSDPPLNQIVAHTFEAGLRGGQAIFDTGAVSWKAGFFHTDSTNDIVSLASKIPGRGYFANVPATLRQGVEAEADFHYGNIFAYVNYAFIDATYQFSGPLASPNNPFADANGDVFVRPGDHIPGIPRHRVKFGADYAFTPKFKAGADVLIAGAQYFVGDEANQNPQLPLYWVANLHAYYQLDEHVQFFGLVNNLFNNRNATYGTFFDTGTDSQLATPVQFTSDPRMVTPLLPVSVYGGVKVTF
jgi:iron complex outermembrane receptor protein